MKFSIKQKFILKLEMVDRVPLVLEGKSILNMGDQMAVTEVMEDLLLLRQKEILIL